MTDRIAIIGAGLGGALMACYLGRAGYSVAVYERRSDPRKHGFIGGRSINLALSERGLSALREVGLADEVLKKVIPMPGRMIHSADKSLHFQAYSKDPADRINSVSRGELSILLINAAEAYPNVKMYFDHRCSAIDFKKPAITFEREDTHEAVRIEVDRIIGADGAYSIARLQMMLNTDRFEYSQDFLEHGYKELTIPPAAACGFAPNDERLSKWGGFAMNPNALHIWPRGSYMMIALPNQDTSFTCTCFWPLSGFEALKTDQQIRSYFEEHFPDAVPLMPTLVEDYQRNPTSSLVTVKCWPWHVGDKSVLLGDAAHAIVPFYGQGMNCAFEDCTALMKCIDKHKSDWRRVFEEFAVMRKPNADAIAEMALHNFIEMRDKTASAIFRGKKKFEHALHAIFPNWFMPLYNMISFSTIPYAQAQRRAARQGRTIKAIAVGAAAIVIAVIAVVIAASMT